MSIKNCLILVVETEMVVFFLIEMIRDINQHIIENKMYRVAHDNRVNYDSGEDDV